MTSRFDRMVAEKNWLAAATTAMELLHNQVPYVPPDPQPRGDNMITVGKVESIGVLMDQDGIWFDINNTRMPVQKAIELGQMLLKAAEAQEQYAVAAGELAAQKAKLDAKYRDMISGLGLEALVDRLDENGALKRVGP